MEVCRSLVGMWRSYVLLARLPAKQGIEREALRKLEERYAGFRIRIRIQSYQLIHIRIRIQEGNNDP